jgi:glyoxylase-like metal-dependent hydrolase (beta-lactamase superfamily II)
MWWKIIGLIFICSCFSRPSLIAQTINFDSLQKKQISVKEEMILIKHNHYIIQPSGNGANTGVYNGKQRLILIDDQWAVLAPKIKLQLKKITPRKPSFFINTHFHYEHTNGNLIFGAEMVPIVAHENARIKMEKDGTLSAPENLVQKAYPVKALPTVTFIERMQLYDDQEIIELTHLRNAHTDGDILIQFKKANIFYTGDIFVTTGLPYIDQNNGGDIYGMINAMNYIINVADEESKIVPGHGKVSGMKEMRAYRDMLTTIRNKTIQLSREKKTEEEVIQIMDTFIRQEKGISSNKDFIIHVLKMVQKHERI